MATAGSVCLQAAMHLNDPSQLVYTTPVLIPYLNMGIQELEEELAVFEVTPIRFESIVQSVAAGASVLASYPVNYIETIKLYERAVGATEWTEVTESVEIDNNLVASPLQGIEHWMARGGLIYINPPASPRQVYLEFIGGLTDAANSATAIDMHTTRRFLALLTARNAARDAGNSVTKAASFKEDIERARDRIVRRMQKNTQSGAGVRRRAYRGRSS